MPNKNEVLTDRELIASKVIAFLDNIICTSSDLI